jgi:hypothetical protein
MKRLLLIAVVFVCGARRLFAADGDFRSFELTATPPPVPALKYHLVFDPMERRPGNAALLYAQAMLLVSNKFFDEVDHAIDLSRGPDTAAFLAAATELDILDLAKLIDLGGRCDESDWQIPVRDMGYHTLLPNLNSLRPLARFTCVNSVRLMRTGDISGALDMIRDGIAIGRNTAREPFVVSGIQGNGILSDMAEPLVELMNRPDSPNLYWALASMPRPLIDFQRCAEAERTILPSSFHELNTAHLESLTAVQWRSIFKQAVEMIPPRNPSGATVPASERGWASEQTVADEVTRNLPQAREYCATTYGLSADEVEGADPFRIVALFWYGQYLEASDSFNKLTALPYSIQIEQMNKMRGQLDDLKKSQPANVFLSVTTAYNRAVDALARGERTYDALTDVEALRSYAAGHEGKLPDRLEQVTDTPVLDNPRSGKAFIYKLDGETATLSDPEPASYPLTYTIRIRK